MTQEPANGQDEAAMLPCPACGLAPGSEDRGDEESPNFCSPCNIVICPFCRSTDNCDHVAAFSWGGDHFAHTSLDAHFSGIEDVQMLGFDEAWQIVDHLVATCPEPITSVEFFNAGGSYSGWYFAPNGSRIRASFDDRVRAMKQEVQERQDDD